MPIIEYFDFKKYKKEQKAEDLKRENSLIKHSPEYIARKQAKWKAQNLRRKAEKLSAEKAKKAELFVKHHRIYLELNLLEESSYLWMALSEEPYYFDEKHKRLCDLAKWRYNLLQDRLLEDGIIYFPVLYPEEYDAMFRLLRSMRLNPLLCKELIGIDPVNEPEGFRMWERLMTEIRNFRDKTQQAEIRIALDQMNRKEQRTEQNKEQKTEQKTEQSKEQNSQS